MIIRCPFEDDMEHDVVEIVFSDGRVLLVTEDSIEAWEKKCQGEPIKTSIKALFRVVRAI